MRILIIIILVLVGLLLASSALDLILNPSDIPILGQLQSYGGLALLSFSIGLAILNLWLIQHPFYEYWLIIMAGSVIGAIYAV